MISTLTRSATTLSHPMGEGQRTAGFGQTIPIHAESLARWKSVSTAYSGVAATRFYAVSIPLAFHFGATGHG